MSKHTPGPWRAEAQHYDSSSYYIRGTKENGEPMTIGLGAVAHIPRSTRLPSKANARLIAAAPTMLSLLERIHADADSQYEGGSNNGRAKFSAELYQELCEFVARFN